jgi:hypothetical protein
VVAADPHRVKSADQAKVLGKSLLLWCAQRSAVERVLPEEEVAPEFRAPEHLQDTVES